MRKEISRRMFLQGTLATAAAGVLSTIGCGADQSSSRPKVQPTPVPTRRLTDPELVATLQARPTQILGVTPTPKETIPSKPSPEEKERALVDQLSPDEKALYLKQRRDAFDSFLLLLRSDPNKFHLKSEDDIGSFLVWKPNRGSVKPYEGRFYFDTREKVWKLSKPADDSNYLQPRKDVSIWYVRLATSGDMEIHYMPDGQEIISREFDGYIEKMAYMKEARDGFAIRTENRGNKRPIVTVDGLEPIARAIFRLPDNAQFERSLRRQSWGEYEPSIITHGEFEDFDMLTLELDQVGGFKITRYKPL